MRKWQNGDFFTDEFIGDFSWNGYETDTLFRNDNNGETFTDVGYVMGAGLTSADGRGMTYLDYDADGDLDVVVIGHRQAAHLLRNDVGQKNHWLGVQLVGTTSNRQGVGARVTIKSGGKTQMRETRAGGSYLQGMAIPTWFGLGQETGVESVTVRWPNGAVQTVKDVKIDSILTVKEDQATSAERAKAPANEGGS